MAQDLVETYTVSNTLVSNKKGVITIALGMKTLVYTTCPLTHWLPIAYLTILLT